MTGENNGQRTGLLSFSVSELEQNLESFPCLLWTSDSLHLWTGRDQDQTCCKAYSIHASRSSFTYLPNPAMCQLWEGVPEDGRHASCPHSALTSSGRSPGRREACRAHPPAVAGSLAALSRDRIGETERKPGGKGLKANRMIYWLNRKKGGLVTGERWQEYVQGLGQPRETRGRVEWLSFTTSLPPLPGPSEGSSSFLKAPSFQPSSFSSLMRSHLPAHSTKSAELHQHGWRCVTGRNKAAISTEMVFAQMQPGHEEKDKYEGSQQCDKCSKELLGLIRVVID